MNLEISAQSSPNKLRSKVLTEASNSIRAFRADKVLRPKKFKDFQLPQGTDPLIPIDVEIGCGVGLHPIQYAQLNPDRYLIAIEHTQEKFSKFERRLAKHPELKHLFAVHADAIAWMTHFLAPESISRVFILYPNPEPKAPNKRWLRMPFMAKVLEILKSEGELILVTNKKDYFDEALEFGQNSWKMKINNQRQFTQENQSRPRTHFEKKYLERGETCYEVVFQKSIRAE